MITLQALVNEQKYSRLSDMEIVKIYFTDNDLEEEGMELIQDLTKSKIAKMKHRHHIVEEWATWLPSKYLYQTYDLDVADKLHTMELDFLVNGCELSKHYLKWATENVPNIIRPKAYFNPLINWLKDRGIEFKSE